MDIKFISRVRQDLKKADFRSVFITVSLLLEHAYFKPEQIYSNTQHNVIIRNMMSQSDVYSIK
jgi:hypothetical protein